MTYFAQMANQPLLLAKKFDLDAFLKDERIGAFMSDHSDLAAAEGDDFWPAPNTRMAQFRPYEVRGGVLHIPVKGVLMNDFPFTFMGMVTGYEYIEAAIARGMQDEAVEGIVLRVDSPGGIVTGCFECADEVYAARSAGTKRIVAHAADSAYSAAYAIASSADEIVVSRTGGVGSIGVLTSHTDRSEAYANEGIKKTYLFAGEHKADGNDAEPLSDAARARIEERLQATYDVFVSTVARNRGLTEAAVRATEALTYVAITATQNGLADRVGKLSVALSAASPASSKTGDFDMAEKEVAKFTLEDLNAAKEEASVAAAEGAHAKGYAEGMEAGAAAERERISAILGSDVAKARPTAAQMFAFDLGLDSDKAIASLEKLPSEAAAPAPKGRDVNAALFEAAMSNADGQNLSAGVEAGAADRAGAEVDNLFALLGK